MPETRPCLFVNVSVDQCDALAPLYLPKDARGWPLPAYIQLDLDTGEISFGIEAAPLSDKSGRFVRWPVPADLRGDMLAPLAHDIRPPIQRVYDGASGRDYRQAASHSNAVMQSIERHASALDVCDLDWRADIRDTSDFVQPWAAELTVRTTDEEIEALGAKIKVWATHGNVVLDKCVTDVLRAMRDELSATATSQ